MKVSHTIKCEKVYFDQTLDGKKPFEIRDNDRAYQRDDVVIMKETDEDFLTSYTGRKLGARIGFVTPFNQKDGWVVFSLIDIKELFT